METYAIISWLITAQHATSTALCTTNKPIVNHHLVNTQHTCKAIMPIKTDGASPAAELTAANYHHPLPKDKKDGDLCYHHLEGNRSTHMYSHYAHHQDGRSLKLNYRTTVNMDGASAVDGV
jgi:hypothetical protein